MADSDGTPLAGLRRLAAKNPVTEQLLAAGQDYLTAKANDLVGTAGAKLGEASKGGDGSLGTVALKAGAKGVAGKVKNAVSGLFSRGSGGGAPSVVSIIEDVDVGVPVREAYDQWTRYSDFSQFTKGVTGVDQTDETTTNWRVKVAKSQRSWTARVTEQIPDERIAWTSEGAKGTTKGVVTFHPLGDNLTKILLVLEYYPKGLFEKTGNIWRAQGRRVRLDLKHFRRHLTMQGEAGGEGWRGEIRDGSVVSGGEDEEQDEAQDEAQAQTDEDDDQDYDEEERDEDDEDYDEQERDEDDEDYDEQERDEDDEDYDEDDEPEEADEEEDEEADDKERVGAR